MSNFEEQRRTLAVEKYIRSKIKCDMKDMISLFYLVDWQHAKDYGFVITKIFHTKPLGYAMISEAGWVESNLNDLDYGYNKKIEQPYYLKEEEKESIDAVIEQIKNSDIDMLVNQTYPMLPTTILEDGYINIEKLAQERFPTQSLGKQ